MRDETVKKIRFFPGNNSPKKKKKITHQQFNFNDVLQNGLLLIRHHRFIGNTTSKTIQKGKKDKRRNRDCMGKRMKGDSLVVPIDF